MTAALMAVVHGWRDLPDGGREGVIRLPAGEVMGMAVVFPLGVSLVAAAPLAVAEGPFRAEAGALWASEFWYHPAVLKSIGTDDEYRAWINRLPCAVCKSPGEWLYEMGEGRCEAAHVARVGTGSGTAIKADYACIPLCHIDHGEQHQKGESAIGGKEWADAALRQFQRAWVLAGLREKFGFQRLEDTPPEIIRTWAVTFGVAVHLPEGWG